MEKITRTILIIAATLMLFVIVGTTKTTNTQLNPPICLELDEEQYIDDIPFDTAEISFQETFELEEEEYIDDIPFDMEEVVRNLNN